MRELAKASRVSVPTLYNLFGGKQALLLGELEETFTNVAASLERARDGSFVERALAACEAGNEDLLAAPGYSRELTHVFPHVGRHAADAPRDRRAVRRDDGGRAARRAVERRARRWVEPVTCRDACSRTTCTR
jgi:AcrR family transcriptional regulator